MRKRILSVLLCLVMLTSLFPATALAAGEEAEGPAAQVGGQTYSSLKAAITAAAVRRSSPIRLGRSRMMPPMDTR